MRELSERVAEQVARLPAGLKQLLDAELAAGNRVIDVEVGRGPDAGKVALILNHPFRAARPSSSTPPQGVRYRELSDRDPQIFEFYATDSSGLSLVTAKFRPMVFTPLVAPPSPSEAQDARMKGLEAKEEASANKRAADAAEAREAAASISPAPPAPHRDAPADAGAADPVQRFLASMVMDYEKWHDGIGYDLDALEQMSDSQLESVERTLIDHQPRDWRDIEALACIDSPAARQAVEAALKSSDTKVRQEAMLHAGEKADPEDREKRLIRSLQSDGLHGGLSEAIDEVPDFHPPGVIEALFRGALHRDSEAAVHFAALLLFRHGKAREPFDWDHRPFFLRFHTTDRDERKAVFRELCERIGVDPDKYLRTRK